MKGKRYQSLATSEQSPKGEFSPKISLKPGAALPKLGRGRFHELRVLQGHESLLFLRGTCPQKGPLSFICPMSRFVEIYEDLQPLQPVGEMPEMALSRNRWHLSLSSQEEGRDHCHS